MMLALLVSLLLVVQILGAHSRTVNAAPAISMKRIVPAGETEEKVLMYAEQIINNIALTEFDTDISKYTATLKDVIAACMDGVEPEDIINIVITSVTGSKDAGRRALQEGESAIMAAYEVQSDDSTETFENLSTQLMEAVTSGEFDTIMGQTATENGATDLEDATSDSLTTSSTTTDTVLMYAEQIINNIALNEFDVDVSKYTATLKQVVAACMDGVEPEEIINMVISSVTADGQRVTGQRALQEGTDAISASYEVLVTGEDTSYDSLSTQLTTAVESGEFNTIMTETATENGATSLEDATSDSVTTQPASQDLVLFYAVQIINNIALNEFNVDVSKYTETLQKVIAACMDGVEPEEIINIVVESVTASGERVSGQRALQEGGDAISVSYEVQVDDPTKTFEMLSEELTTSVETGEFNTIMAETATETGATGLVDTTSDGVAIQDLLPTAEVAPTAAPTPNPQEMVLMFVEQVINNVVMEEFNVDISKYTATLKDVIAACMDGVEPEEIINMVISSVTASGERVTGQRALQEGGDSINVSYEVQTNGEDMSYSSLSEQLTTAVTSGEFDTIMGQTATENGATGLDEATSDTVTTQPASEDLVLFYVEQIINNVAMEEFNVDVSQYTATLKKVIAACMDGVEPEEIIQMVVTSFTSTGERVTGLRALQEGVDAISVSYEVQVDDSSASFESLSTELVEAVTTGEFDTILQETATEDGSVALEDGTSDTITVEDLLPDAAPGAPTVAPTASPDPKKEVLFYAEQIINNIALNEFDTDVSLYTSTLKQVISACMDGVEPTEIIELVVTSLTSHAVPAELRGAALPQDSTTKAIKAAYKVQVESATETFDTLSAELQDAVESGDFNTYLSTFGNSTGAVYFVGATSNAVTITNLLVDDNSDSNNGLSGGAIAGIVIAVLAVVALACAAGYYYHSKSVSAGLKTNLLDGGHAAPPVAVPVGGGSRFYGKGGKNTSSTSNPITGEL